MPLFVWNQKHDVFVYVCLNANEQLLPVHHLRRGLCFYSSCLSYYGNNKQICFDYHLNCTHAHVMLHFFIMQSLFFACNLKPCVFKLMIYSFLSTHIHSVYTESQLSRRTFCLCTKRLEYTTFAQICPVAESQSQSADLS